MAAPAQTPVEEMSIRLRERVSPLRLVSSRPAPESPTLHSEIAALRDEVKQAMLCEAERRGAWAVLKEWGTRFGLAAGGFLLAKLLEIIR